MEPIMNIRSLLSLILLFTTAFDGTLFATKRSFDEVDDNEYCPDDNDVDDEEDYDEQEDDKDDAPKVSSSKSAKKTYPCNLCPKTFKHLGSLYKHTQSVHEGVTYPCNLCPRIFISIQLH